MIAIAVHLFYLCVFIFKLKFHYTKWMPHPIRNCYFNGRFYRHKCGNFDFKTFIFFFSDFWDFVMLCDVTTKLTCVCKEKPDFNCPNMPIQNDMKMYSSSKQNILTTWNVCSRFLYLLIPCLLVFHLFLVAFFGYLIHCNFIARMLYKSGFAFDARLFSIRPSSALPNQV